MVATKVECIIVFLSLVLTLPVLFVDNAFATTPATPTGLTAVSVSPTQVDLSWSSISIGLPGHHTLILRCEGVACTPITPAIFDNPLGETTFSDLTVSEGTTYGYRVREVHNAASTNSAIVYVTTQSVPVI